MSLSKKDYDPLSGLFGSRAPGEALPEVGDDLTGGMPTIDGADAPEPLHLRPRVTPVRRAPPPPNPAGPDPAALAKILARAAVAKAGAPAPAPPAPPAPAETVAPPRAAPDAALSPLSRSVPLPVSPKSAEHLARASAMNAALSEAAPVPPAAASRPPPAAAPPAAAVPLAPPASPAAAKPPAPLAPPKPTAAAPPPAAAPASSRLGALTAPPLKRAVSLAEALDAARIAEAAAAVAAAHASQAPAPPAPAPPAPAATSTAASLPASPPAAAPPVLDLTERVQEFLQSAVPGASLYVAAARLAEDRGGLKPLWSAHRARALAAGDVPLALTMAAVLHAISQVPRGALLASLVVQDGQELLVWFDLRTGQMIAVLPGARGWGMAL